MAIGGARPKPGALRVVDGTHRADRHGKLPDDAPIASGGAEQKGSPLVCPRFLKGEGKKAWDRWVKPFFWITSEREPAAIAFCELWSEFRRSPENFNAARHGQLRAYMQELGLTDERNRKADDGKGKDPAEGYFD